MTELSTDYDVWNLWDLSEFLVKEVEKGNGADIEMSWLLEAQANIEEMIKILRAKYGK